MKGSLVLGMRISRTTDEAGRKELIAIAGGYRESGQPWRELLVDLERQGPARAPVLANSGQANACRRSR